MGDLVVNISVYIPKTLDKDEKIAIEKFKNSDNFKGDITTKQNIFSIAPLFSNMWVLLHIKRGYIIYKFWTSTLDFLIVYTKLST